MTAVAEIVVKGVLVFSVPVRGLSTTGKPDSCVTVAAVHYFCTKTAVLTPVQSCLYIIFQNVMKNVQQ